jgi:hypothetical protein
VRRTLVAEALLLAAVAAVFLGSAPDGAARAAAPALEGPTRTLPGLDTTRNILYAKAFVLAATGRRAEIWVARDLRFPAGDCRNRVNRATRVRITKAQAKYLAAQFDRVIYERQRTLFGVPRPRNGSLARDRRFSSAGRSSRVIVLVDNVRDENYFDRNNARNVPYVAGFYDGEVDDALDRNVVSLDAYDWPHRLRASPPHAPVAGNNCTSAPARPFMYEATLAHEYQHLLQDLTDPNEHEDAWVDEGLADFAQTLSGYARPARRINQLGFDSHVQCILGWLNVRTPFNPQPRRGGPENSLTRWGDEGDAEILCDYGAAYTFVHFLADRYGTNAAGELYREPDIGLTGFTSVLQRLGAAEDGFGLMHDWSAMLALDAALDRGTPLRIGDAQRFKSATLSAEINWDNPDAYSEPGAPPNGSDFVRLRDGAGRYLSAAELETLSFRGTRPTRAGLSYTVQLIGYTTTDPSVPATQVTLQLTGGVAVDLATDALKALFDPRVDVVAAIVTFDDRAESLSRVGRYTLTVNGVAQPGG